MKRVYCLLVLALFCTPVAAKDLTVYLVRHAEKNLHQKTDPVLTQRGLNRALRYVEMFQHVPVSAVYSTDTTRTRETARPLAENKNLPIKLYKVGELSKEKLLQIQTSGAVFIVGHSNTVPKLVNRLIGDEKYQELDESEYDDLFVVNLAAQGKSGSERLIIPLETD